ncbi:MAG: FG-GAP-like repeat-containing protein, partial [Kiritimatiellae bacterium]|nr:FG-GAP-like repeat-containing protein [Kiritimatiellia bacterium]
MRIFRSWLNGLLFCCLGAAECAALSQPLVVSNRWSGAVLAQRQIVSVTVTTQKVASGLSRPIIALYPADVDGDGAVDLIAAGNENNNVFWMRNTASGTVWLTNLVAQGIIKPRAVGAGDLNRDGNMDIVASVSGSSNTLMAWSSVDGSGTNWTGYIIDSDFDNAFSIVVRDVDGDGHLDVVASSSGSDQVAWWKNANGLGTSWSRQGVASGFLQAMDAQCADMDGDGDLDIVGVAYGDGQVTWWENMNGIGTSWTAHSVATGFMNAYSLALSDLDGDGDVDIVASADVSATSVRIWRNNGTGTVWTPETVVSSGFSNARSVWCADIDDDGDMDIAAAAYGAHQVAWFEQRGSEWKKWVDSTVTTNARTVCCADFNGDGRPDVAGAGLNNTLLHFGYWRNDPVYGLGPFTALPAAVSTNDVQSGQAVLCAVTNSPVTMGATQWVCRGWAGTGSIVSGTGTNTGAQVVAAPSSIAWDWFVNYYLTVTNDGHGLVTLGSGWYSSGASVTLQAVATTPGYVFLSWSGVPSAQATNNPLSLIITNAVTVKANFGTDGRVITASAGAGGSVVPEGEVLVAFGESQSFGVTPDPGWRIARVWMNGEEAGVSDWITFLNVREDGTLWVEFERDEVALKVVSPYGNTSPESGITTFYEGGTTARCAVLNSPISVGLHTQMVCSGWTGTGSVPASGAGVETPEFAMTEYSTVSWLWKTQALLEVFYTGSGTSDISRAWCDEGSEVQVTAQAAEGYVFNGWSGDVPNGAERDNPITLRMTGSKQLTASFGLFRPTINAGAGNHGIIEPNGYLSVDYLSTPEFAITPDEGYRIEAVLIDGVSVGVPNYYQFPSVEADHTIVANFTKADYNLTVTSTHGSADPSPGTNVLRANDAFQCRLAGSPETNGVSTQYVCVGWTGAGSVPASGTTLDTGLLLLYGDSS